MCYFQGAGSNVIRCRKDGNWTGSFRLCQHSKGQCSLPQNLHPSLQYSCKRGHGIGLYAQFFFYIITILFSYCWCHLSLFSVLLFLIVDITHSFSVSTVYNKFNLFLMRVNKMSKPQLRNLALWIWHNIIIIWKWRLERGKYMSFEMSVIEVWFVHTFVDFVFLCFSLAPTQTHRWGVWADVQR